MAIFSEEDSHITEESATCGAVPSSPIGLGDIDEIAQTFTAGDDYDLTKVTLKLRKTGSPGRAFVEIYAVDGNGFPTGSLLGFGSFEANLLTENVSGELKDIPITPTSLSSGTVYAMVITAPEGTVITDWVKLLGSVDEIDGGYADGTTLQNVEGTWEERVISGTFFNDAYFQTYSEGEPREVDTPTPTDTNTGISVTPLLEWQIDGSDTVEDNDFFFIYLNETGTFTDDDLLVGWRTSLELQILSGLSIGVTYYWQVQAISEDGDLLNSSVWSFTTSAINPPAPSGGANPNGLNNMITMQRLVGAAKNSIFYEDI